MAEPALQAQHLTALRVEHADLDYAITTIESLSYYDREAVSRMKKRKLKLKEQIDRITIGGTEGLDEQAMVA